MERFLLFDSNCAPCSQLARSIEETSDGWLGVKSLREASVQSMLSEINPRWKWRPTLLEVQGEEKRMFTGVRLSAHLLRGLGPRKTWNVFQAVYRASLPQQRSQPVNASRRYFWKRTGAVVAGLSLSLGLGSFIDQSHVLAASAPSKATTTQLSPEELHRVAHHPVVLEANSSFGISSWDEGIHFDQGNGTKGYVLVHGIASSSPMFVGMSEPDATGAAASIAGRIVKKDQDTSEIHWFTTNGYTLAITSLHRDGKGSTVPAVIDTATVNPNFSCNLGCFALCIGDPSGISLFCAVDCINCAVNPSFFGCLFCTACAGRYGVVCALRCCRR